MRMLDYKLNTEVVEDNFYHDFIDLMKKNKHGHMEKWEYDSQYGAIAWGDLISSPNKYYLPQEDISNINNCINIDDLLTKISGCRTLIELGAGCKTSLLMKTVPIINKTKLGNYVSIDATYEVAKQSADFISAKSGVKSSSSQLDFYTDNLNIETSDNIVVFWGSSLGNFGGKIGDNPFNKLVGFFNKIHNSLNKGDKILFSFDKCQNENKVLSAYSENNLSKQILSILHLAKRDLLINGYFNPNDWKHQPFWDKKHSQCAHLIYPTTNQLFQIGNMEFNIKAHDTIHSNNSYKYSVDRIKEAAIMAGFNDVNTYGSQDMNLLYGIK